MTFDHDDLEYARAAWTFRGQTRPDFAEPPGEGQESVWDYPRPPVYVPDDRRVEVYAADQRLARTGGSIRVLETGHPPSVYLPPESVDHALLIPSRRHSLCEWKGQARYFHVKGPAGLIADALWCYPEAFDTAASIAGWYACYPSLLRCFVAGEPVSPQPGGYYGGWVTRELAGPFKGAPGTAHW